MNKILNDLNKRSVVAITFSTVKYFDCKKDKKIKHIELDKEAIIEIAAVKVQDKKIEGHFHSFVAIEGYDAQDIEFGDFNYLLFGATPNLLIGAPSLNEVAKKLKDYVGDSILMPYFEWFDNPLEILKNNSKKYGYVFDNPVITPLELRTAMALKSSMADGAIAEDTSILQIADIIHEKPVDWTDIFAEHHVYFNPEAEEEWRRDRNEPLTWALAFAKYCISLQEEAEDIDENLAFLKDHLPV